MSAQSSRRPGPASVPASAGTSPCAGGGAWAVPCGLVVAVILAWSNTLGVPFLLDDHESILGNPTIRDLLSADWLLPPATGGETVSGRPVLNFSFALNYAVGGTAVAGYHVGNLLIHAVATLLLYGVVRRLLVHREAGGGRLGGEARGWTASWRAGAVAALWAVHPLQTAAVTYLSQRAESLAALWVLASLYCFVRAAERGEGGRRWAAGCVAACLVGMGTKETAVVTPLLVLLVDWALFAGSFAEAWRRRRGLYLALGATWSVLAVLVLTNPGRGGSAGFGAEVGVVDYLLIQGTAIPRYLRLAVLPVGLVFDHGAVGAGAGAAAFAGLAFLVVLAAGAGWVWRRDPVLGALGVGFFLMLAPSSSFAPVATQTIAEHRMYLPLACVVLAVAHGVGRMRGAVRGRGLRAGILVAAVGTLGMLTWQRNTVFGSELALWSDTVAKRPENPRARNNLGLALANAGRVEEAAEQYRRAIALQPNHAFAHDNLAAILLAQGRFAEALAHCEAAVAAAPGFFGARVNLARALAALDRGEAAEAQYRRVLAAEPEAFDALHNLGALLVSRGAAEEGEALLRRALAAKPDLAEAHNQLGRVREKAGDLRSAEAEYREAIRLKPELAAAHRALGAVLQRRGDPAGAEASLRRSLALEPSAEAHYQLGNLAARARQFAAAMAEYRTALDMDPAHVPARNNLGNCLLALGRFREAVLVYEEVLRRRPEDAAVRRNLAVAREQAGAE